MMVIVTEYLDETFNKKYPAVLMYEYNQPVLVLVQQEKKPSYFVLRGKIFNSLLQSQSVIPGLSLPGRGVNLAVTCDDIISTEVQPLPFTCLLDWEDCINRKYFWSSLTW